VKKNPANCVSDWLLVSYASRQSTAALSAVCRHGIPPSSLVRGQELLTIGHCLDVATVTHFIVCQTPFLLTCAVVALSCLEPVQ